MPGPNYRTPSLFVYFIIVTLLVKSAEGYLKLKINYSDSTNNVIEDLR